MPASPIYMTGTDGVAVSSYAFAVNGIGLYYFNALFYHCIFTTSCYTIKYINPIFSIELCNGRYRYERAGC
jgi:hypothetical protein